MFWLWKYFSCYSHSVTLSGRLVCSEIIEVGFFFLLFKCNSEVVSQTHSNITTLNEGQFLKHMYRFLPALLQEGEMGLKKHLASALYHAETKTWPHTYMLYSEPRLKWLYLVCLVLALSGSDSLVRNLWGICWSWWSLGNALRLCCIVQGMFWVLDGITSGLPCFSWGHADHWIEFGEPLPSWQVSLLHQLLLWRSLLATGVTSILVKKKGWLGPSCGSEARWQKTACVCATEFSYIFKMHPSCPFPQELHQQCWLPSTYPVI